MENDFGFSEDAPKPAPKETPYPRRMYSVNGAETTVHSLKEENELGPEWSRKRTPAPPVPSAADQASEFEALKLRVSNLEAAFAKLLAMAPKK